MALHDDEIPAKDLPGAAGDARQRRPQPVRLPVRGESRRPDRAPLRLHDTGHALSRPAGADRQRELSAPDLRPVDLYAEEEADLEEVLLFANPALAGTTLTVH